MNPPAPLSLELQTLTPLDWLVVAIYMGGVFAIAFWAWPKIKDCGSFLVGSRKMGKVMNVAAAFAGGTNANHPIAVSAAAYQSGLPGVWLSLTWILITPFFWMYPPAIRRLRIVTFADFMRMRFGSAMAMIFKVVSLIKIPIAKGLAIKSAAIVLEVMSGGAIAGTTAEALIAIPTLIYSLLGGVIAAYATDVYQSLLIVALSFLLIPFAVSKAGGVASLDAQIDDRLTTLFAGADGTFGFWWIFWFAIGIMFAAAASTGTHSASAKNEMAARSAIFGMGLKRFCTLGWGLVGLFSIALFAGHPLLDPKSGMAGASPDNVFPLASAVLLPIGLRGLMVASILASVMAGLTGGVLGFGGMMVNNVYQEHFVKKASPAHYLFMARVFSTVGLLLGWWVASTITDIVEFSTVVEAIGSLTGIAILAAIMWRRMTAAGAIASVIVASVLFLAVNRPDWGASFLPGGASLFQWLGLAGPAKWMASLYHLDLGALGFLDSAGNILRLPVQIKYPLYLIPTAIATVVVSLLTRQHNQHAVDEFYCRLDTPVGEEEKIRDAGFQVDQLENLDSHDPTIAKEDHDVSKRLLVVDLLRLPGLLLTGKARLSDYKWDWIGIAGSVIFVVLFLLMVEWIGSYF